MISYKRHANDRTSQLRSDAGGWQAPRCGAIAAAVAALLCGSATAQAGTTLLSRSSTIHAVGDPAIGDGFDLTRSSASFDPFAELVGSGEMPENGLIASAQQHSLPGELGASGAGLEGAFGEGHVRSAVIGEGSASAHSELEMRFQVEDVLFDYSVGGSIGATGAASVKVELMPLDAGTLDLPIFVVAVEVGEEGGKLLDQSGSLSPGQYLLRVRADADGLLGQTLEADAYFSFKLQLSEAVGGSDSGGGGDTGGGTGAGSPPASVPLPPAVFAGGGMLAAMSLARLRRRRS